MPTWVKVGEEGTTRETFGKTLRALFQNASPVGWNIVNTNSILPNLISDEDMASGQIYTEIAEGVLFEEGDSRWRNMANDDTQGDRETDLIITVFAPTKYMRQLLQDEVERILKQNRPSPSYIIQKSNGTDDSAIRGLSFPLPDWHDFTLGLNTPERSAKTQMILKVYWYAHWQ